MPPGVPAAATRITVGGESLERAIFRLERRLAERSDALQLGEPALRAALSRLWHLFATWMAAYMTAHPRASPPELRAALTAIPHFTSDLDSPPQISVVKLAGAPAPALAVALEWGWWGSFFVLEQDMAGRFRPAWSIEPPALEGYPRRDELGYWALLKPWYHDGPLSGTLLALPAGRGGKPRFLVDALTSPGIGDDRPGQISIWEWSEHQAIPLFIESYGTSRTIHDETPMRREDDRLVIAEMADAKMLSIHGSHIDGPVGFWTLRLTPGGVLDQGHTWKDPAEQLVDDLLDRVRRHRDAADLASPAAVAQLYAHGMDGLGSGWDITRRGSRQVLRLVVDDGSYFLSFTIEQRRGRGYVSGVEWSPGD